MWGYFGVLSAWGLLCVFVVTQKAFGKRLGDHLKIPIKRIDKETGFMNINRLDPGDLNDFLSQSMEI